MGDGEGGPARRGLVGRGDMGPKGILSLNEGIREAGPQEVRGDGEKDALLGRCPEIKEPMTEGEGPIRDEREKDTPRVVPDV